MSEKNSPDCINWTGRWRIYIVMSRTWYCKSGWYCWRSPFKFAGSGGIIFRACVKTGNKQAVLWVICITGMIKRIIFF